MTRTSESITDLYERYLYRSSHVGMDLHEEDMYVTTAGIPLQNGDTALKQFQLSNHLGNVLAVVNGERKAIPDVTGNSITLNLGLCGSVKIHNF